MVPTWTLSPTTQMKSRIAHTSRASFDFGPAALLQGFAQVKHIIGSTPYSVLWMSTHTYPCYLSRIFRTRSRYATYSCENHPAAGLVDHSSLFYKQILRARPSSCRRRNSKRSRTDLRQLSSNRKHGASSLRSLHTMNRMYSSLVLI